MLDQALDEANKFCSERGMPLDYLSQDAGQVFKSVAIFGDYADKLLGNEEWRKSFYVYENTVSALYAACKPEILGQPAVRRVAVFQYLRGIVEALVDGQDVTAVEHKNIEIVDLLAFIKKKLEEMLNKNVSRRDSAERLQAIIDRYNSGASSTENYYDELVNFAESMKAEDERSVREGLTDDEVEIFDLLKKDKMTEAETQKVKLAAKALLKRILEEHPRVVIEDWFRESQTRQIVKDALAEVLDSTLPDSYDKQLFQKKRDDVFEVILDYALSGAKFAA